MPKASVGASFTKRSWQSSTSVNGRSFLASASVSSLNSALFVGNTICGEGAIMIHIAFPAAECGAYLMLVTTCGEKMRMGLADSIQWKSVSLKDLSSSSKLYIHSHLVMLHPFLFNFHLLLQKQRSTKGIVYFSIYSQIPIYVRHQPLGIFAPQLFGSFVKRILSLNVGIFLPRIRMGSPEMYLAEGGGESNGTSWAKN